jgi:hypothetical protein
VEVLCFKAFCRFKLSSTIILFRLTSPATHFYYLFKLIFLFQ